jgi:mono/diheme cytochrome c family protein
MKTILKASAISTLVVTAGLTAGCFGQKKTLDWEFMPDMYDSTNFKAQSEDVNSHDGSANRLPPDGTVPRGFQGFHYGAGPAENERAGKELVNPVPRTKSTLERGQKIFNTYCIVCHGAKGLGDGTVTTVGVPRPPSLVSDKVRKWADGNIFHVITMGQNNMKSYRTQVASEDRWAVIHYIRALARAANPTPEDVQEMKATEKKP